MAYYIRNGNLIGEGDISKDKSALYDLTSSRFFSGSTIFGSLQSLAITLASGTVATGSGVANITEQLDNIHAANPAFNTFAVVGYSNLSEGLSGTGVAGGRKGTGYGFSYNTSNSNYLSTGNTIEDMSGGAAAGLPEIDGYKWMAMAQYDGTNFDGIVVWIFTGDGLNGSKVVQSGTRPVTRTADIFYPDGTSSDYHHIYPVVIASNGTVYEYSVTSGGTGFNFSNNAQPGTAGYYTTTRFAYDDGQWGFTIGGLADGNGGGTIFTTNGYGMGNQNSNDLSYNYVVWDGFNTSSAGDQLGIVFTGDA